jgi:hypothetical protein
MKHPELGQVTTIKRVNCKGGLFILNDMEFTHLMDIYLSALWRACEITEAPAGSCPEGTIRTRRQRTDTIIGQATMGVWHWRKSASDPPYRTVPSPRWFLPRHRRPLPAPAP